MTMYYGINYTLHDLNNLCGSGRVRSDRVETDRVKIEIRTRSDPTRNFSGQKI